MGTFAKNAVLKRVVAPAFRSAHRARAKTAEPALPSLPASRIPIGPARLQHNVKPGVAGNGDDNILVEGELTHLPVARDSDVIGNTFPEQCALGNRPVKPGTASIPHQPVARRCTVFALLRDVSSGRTGSVIGMAGSQVVPCAKTCCDFPRENRGGSQTAGCLRATNFHGTRFIMASR